MYPRQINLSEEFLQALKNEYYRLTLEEDAERPVSNRPQKFVKALQFHVADLEKNKEAELEALRAMVDEEKKPIIKTDKDLFGSPALGRSELAAKEERRKKIFKPLKGGIKKTEESTEPYQATVKGEKKEGCSCVNNKKEEARRKEVEKENIESIKESTDLEFIYESMLNENAVIANLIRVINNSIEKKQYRDAKESLIALTHMKFGGTPVTEMPEYSKAIEELAAKLGADIKTSDEARAAEKAARVEAHKPENILAQAKGCNFENAQLGYVNGWGEKIYPIFSEVLKLHSKCKQQNPEEHKETTSHPYGRYRGVSETRCSCGLSHGVDSTD